MRFSIKTLINFTAFILSIILVFFIFPLLFLCFIPFFLYRQVVIQLAKIVKKGTLGKIVTSRSSILITEKIYENPINTLISVLLVEGLVDVQELRQDFQTRVVELIDKNSGELRYPEVKQNVQFWFGFPFFRNLKKFDLKELIYENDDEESCHENIIRRLTFKPFSKDKPLWEIIVIRDYKPDPKKSLGICPNKKYSCVIIRTHHGVADAFSQLRLVQALSPSGDKFNFIKATDYTQQSAIKYKPIWSQFIRNAWIALKIPFELGRMVPRKLFLLDSWTELEQRNKKFMGKCGAVVTVLNKGQRNKAQENFDSFHCYASPNFPLNDINEIKICYGVSGTAVMYAAVVGALRNTVFNQLSRIPSNVLLCFPLPLPGASGKLRNHVTVGSIMVPMAEKDEVKRLHKIHQRLEYLKTSTLPISFAVWMKAGGSFPYCVSRAGKRIVMASNAIFISNVAGPTKDQADFAGYPIKDFLASSGFCVSLSAISILLLSTCGNIRVQIGADKKMLQSEQAKRFTEQFFVELDTLRKLSNFSIDNV